jgi:hypothetical protein
MASGVAAGPGLMRSFYFRHEWQAKQKKPMQILHGKTFRMTGLIVCRLEMCFG